MICLKGAKMCLCVCCQRNKTTTGDEKSKQMILPQRYTHQQLCVFFRVIEIDTRIKIR